MSFSLQTFALLTLSLLALPLEAQDKSPSRGGVVSLPGPGGTVQKEGSGFHLQSNTGAVNFEVPLPALPARTGLSPKLSINYNQFTGDSGSGLGVGWSLSLPTLGLDMEAGTPLRTAKNDKDFFTYNTLLFRGEPLVMLGQRDAFIDFAPQRSEIATSITFGRSDFFVEVLDALGQKETLTVPGGFLVRETDGTRLYFSADPEIAEGVAAEGFVSQWPLVLEVNPNGEAIRYFYDKSVRKQSGRAVLNRVEFAGGASVYEFETMPARASLIDYRSSFAQRNTVLYSGLKASFRGQLEAQWCFAYVSRSLDDSREQVVRTAKNCEAIAREELQSKIDPQSINVLDQLKAIYRYGRTLTREIRNPAIYFDYSSWTSGELAGRDLVRRAGNLDWLQNIDKQAFELADVNHDALLDIIYSDRNGEAARVYAGEADTSKAWQMGSSWMLLDGTGAQEQRIRHGFLGNSYQFADINGDSYADVVRLYDGGFDVFLADKTGDYSRVKKTVTIPRFNPDLFEGGAAQFLDMDQDGLTDILLPELQSDGTVGVMVIRNQSLRDYKGKPYIAFSGAKPTHLRLPIKTQDTRFFAQAQVKLSDLNGDNLPDLVVSKRHPETRVAGVCFYENTGNLYDPKNYSLTETHSLAFGVEDRNDIACGAGQFVELAGMNEREADDGMRNLWIIDVNGDGILDFASAIGSPDKLRVWLGLGNASFMPTPTELPLNLPIRVDTEARFRSRIADLDGDGQAEILVLQADGVMVIDFNRTATNQLVKANLLTSVAYETGLRYDIRYATSIDELERDRKNGLPSSGLHFPVIVAKQIATSDGTEKGLRKNVQVEEYLFHNPDYNLITRKFLGFARVERIFYGDDYGSSSTQASRLTTEEYFTSSDRSGVTLRGLMKRQTVSAFTPHDSFIDGARLGQQFDTQNAESHSLASYTARQSLPKAGAVKLEKTWNWEAASAVKTPLLETFYKRLLSETSTHFENNQQASSRVEYLDFDTYNYPARTMSTQEAIAGPDGQMIPARQVETRLDYETSRSYLAEAGILNAPASIESRLLPDDTLLSRQSFVYEAQRGLKLEERSTVISQRQSEQERIKSWTYNALGNVIEAHDQKGLIEAVDWDPRGIFPVRSRNALGHESLLAYGDGNPEAPFPQGFDPSSNLAHITHGRNASGEWFFISYDDLGRTQRYQTSDGREQVYEYRMGLFGQPSLLGARVRRYAESETLPVGESRWVHSLKAYNSLGDELASLEENESSSGGVRVIQMKEYNRNSEVIREYVPFELPLTSIDAVMKLGSIKTDAPGVISARFSYDELGRLGQKLVNAHLREDMQYPIWGEVTTSTYAVPQGESWVNKTVVEREVKAGDTVFASQDELGYWTRFDRDAWLNLASILLPGESSPRLIAYNSEGLLEWQSVPAIGIFEFSYDLRGNSIAESRTGTDGVQLYRKTRVFDALDRLESEAIDGKESLRNRYDSYPAMAEVEGVPGAVTQPIGQLTVIDMVDPNGLFAYQEIAYYDAADRVITREVKLGQHSYRDQAQYTLDSLVRNYVDPFGVRTVQTLARSTKTLAVSMQTSWMAEEEPVLSYLSYNPQGQTQRIDYRAGITSQIQYEPETLQPSVFETYGKDGEKLQDLQYKTDGRGQIHSIRDALKAGRYGMVDRSASFSYNDRGELMQASRFGQNHQYRYNAAGNFQENSEIGEGDWQKSTDSSLLPLGTTDNSYQFDAAGQLKSGGRILEARYDSKGQMIFARTDAAEVFLGYSPSGKRVYRFVKPTEGAVKESFYPMASIIVENGVNQSFIIANGQRLGRVDHDKQEWFYYVRDHLGSSDLMLTSDGVPVEQILYLPYGNEVQAAQLSTTWQEFAKEATALQPKQPTRHRFTGQYRDDDLGVYDFGVRQYDARLGRFLGPDPLYILDPNQCVASPLDCNLFGYARNNPVKYNDPTGNNPLLGAAVVGAVIGASLNVASEILTKNDLKTMSTEQRWKTLGTVALSGAVQGAVASLISPAMLGKVGATIVKEGVSFGVGLVADATKSKISGKMDKSSMQEKVGIGAIKFVLGKSLGKVTDKVKIGNGLSAAKGFKKAAEAGKFASEKLKETGKKYWSKMVDKAATAKADAIVGGAINDGIDAAVGRVSKDTAKAVLGTNEEKKN